MLTYFVTTFFICTCDTVCKLPHENGTQIKELGFREYS